jgi:hypothetical protein
MVIPGLWECPTCGFVLSRNYLNPITGEVGVNDEDAPEPCRNDGTALVRQTWMSYALGLEKMVNHDRDELREAVMELRVTIGLCRFCGGMGEQGDPDVATWECSWCAPACKLVARYPGWLKSEVPS